MDKRLFRPTCFAIATSLGLSVAALAGAQEPMTQEPVTQEPEAPALSAAGWSLNANQVGVDERDESLRLRGDVLLSRGAWRVAATTAEVTGEAITVSGAVRIAGPAVYVMSTSAVIRGDQIEAVDGYVASDGVQLDAARVVVSTRDATVRLFDVGSSRHSAGRASAEAIGTRRTSAP